MGLSDISGVFFPCLLRDICPRAIPLSVNLKFYAESLGFAIGRQSPTCPCIIFFFNYQYTVIGLICKTRAVNLIERCSSCRCRYVQVSSLITTLTRITNLNYYLRVYQGCLDGPDPQKANIRRKCLTAISFSCHSSKLLGMSLARCVLQRGGSKLSVSILMT